MIFNVNYQDLNGKIDSVIACIAKGEKICNYVDYVPCASSYSGLARALVGKVQVVAFLALFAFSKIVSSEKDCDSQKNEFQKKCQDQVFNGVSNVFRGYVATIFFVGGIACLGWDYKLGRLDGLIGKLTAETHPG